MDSAIGLFSIAYVNVSTQWLDYLKVQAQLNGINKRFSPARPLMLGRAAISSHGFLHLWTGYESMIVRSILYQGLRSWIFSSLVVYSSSKDKYHTTPTINRAIYGGLAAGIAGFAASPFDFAVLRKQCGKDEALFNKAKGKNFGIHLLGAPATALKYGVMATTMLPIYDSMLEFLARVLGEVSFTKIPAIIVASMFGALTSMPFDNIKTKLQSQYPEAGYKGALDCYHKTIARETIFGLYVGYWYYVARISLNALGTVYMVDFLRSILHE